jgi:crotonobetainyl-CoA:carnitine CoA-transferase CaiB-like acyl-CoA transferase
MAAYLSKTLGDHDDECLKALGRGEHVHVSFIETLIEQIQLTMQGYTAPARRAHVVSRAPSSTKLPYRSSTKHAQCQVVVPEGGGVAVTLLRNEVNNDLARYARAEEARAEIKNNELEKEKRTIAKNVKVLNYAKSIGVNLRLQVGVNCTVYVFFFIFKCMHFV